MTGAVRESMDILRAKQVARTVKGETRTFFLKNEFFRSNPTKFSGELDLMKADEWLEQIVKSFEILHIYKGEIWVALATYQQQRKAEQWCKYAKNRVEHTWEAFTHAFQEMFLLPTAKERLSRQFEELLQLDILVAEFEATFTSLSCFALELVAIEERRCLEFERRLRPKILMKVVGNMI
ncbi:uncharacterized protein LOC114299749 [Camellia sinensis]|uniref:uncharacterized protein LOC114299749 n=1 Tax=Camellia sinensis TaxID=4442 RepID=UPI001035A6E1|nr:uncharacterized protein LOC114299749 [Camellia sinensis]